MATPYSFFTSSIGRKIVMALTGLGLIGFVIAHLLGNLQVFAGQEVFNEYAAFLKGLGPLLWVARLGLLAIFLLHIATALSLWKDNRDARPDAYRKDNTRQATAASLYMMQSGTVLLIFVVIHLLHFTFGSLQPEYYALVDAKGRHDVYSMLVLGFKSKGYVVMYVAAMIALGFHLRHAMASMFQTVGIYGPKLTRHIENAALGLAAAIVVGYISIPLAVTFGIVTLPAGGAL